MGGRSGKVRTRQVRAHDGRRGGDGAETQGLLELQGCQSVEALRILAAIHRLRTAGMLSEGGSEGGECLAEQVPPCCRMRSAW